MPVANPISQSNRVEFNDSVLETQAWNSSRYGGRQLTASRINVFTEGDSTYNRTPVISNYSRNIYLGSRVIGMREPGLGPNDDPTLTPFPGFSYVTVDEYLTINEDDTITRRSVRGGVGQEDDLNAKKGFYQSWYKDFPIGSSIRIKTLDPKLVQSLEPRYNVFNNSGQLQKCLLVTRAPKVFNNDLSVNHDSGSFYAASYTTASFRFDYVSGSGNPHGNDIGAEYSIFNYLLLVQEFFSGSLVADLEAGGLVDLGLDTNVAVPDVVGDDELADEDDGFNNQGGGGTQGLFGGGG